MCVRNHCERGWRVVHLPPIVTANKFQGKKRKLFTTITWMKIDRKEGLCCNYPREFTSFCPLFTYCSNIYSAFTVFPPNVGNFLHIMTLFIKMAQRILFFVFDIKLFSNDEFNASQKKFKFISKTFGHFRKFSEASGIFKIIFGNPSTSWLKILQLRLENFTRYGTSSQTNQCHLISSGRHMLNKLTYAILKLSGY